MKEVKSETSIKLYELKLENLRLHKNYRNRIIKTLEYISGSQHFSAETEIVANMCAIIERCFSVDKKKQEEYHFVKEQIKKIPPDRKKIRMRLAWTVVLAVIFGVVAAIVFCAVRPAIEKMVRRKDNAVVITGQEEESADTPESSEPVYITETQQMEPEDYQILQNKLYAIGREANKSVVSVKAIGETTDWFDDAYQTESQGTGIIVADSGDQYMIVTEKNVIQDASQVDVTFYDDNSASATLLAYDANTGMAVLSVDKKELPESTASRVAAATFGTSSVLSQGTVVIAIGSPLGEPFSILTGNVTSSSHEISTIDANYKVISTDINASGGGSCALINLRGEVVGFMLQNNSKGEAQSTVTAIGISEITKLLEKMSNGEAPSYLGIEISTVTAEIAKENQLPQGVYIKQVITDSPAMQAGIQTGDVLIKIGGKEIKTVDQYEDYMLSTKDGQQTNVTVKRMGADGKYQDLSFKVTFGTLQQEIEK